MIEEVPDNINEDDGTELPARLTPKDLVEHLGKELIFLGVKRKIENISSWGISCCAKTFSVHYSYKELAKYKVKLVDGTLLYGK
jgi:hypothetical protein